MATTAKKPQPKPVRVMPTVTDPSMRNPKGPAEMMLNEELGDTPDDREIIFNGAAKTKEEQSSEVEEAAPVGSNNSTILIIVFALIVIALVGLVVWMMMKQSNDKKDEEEIRRVIQPQPHPRNNMPMMHNRDQAGFEEHQRNMQAMYQQQQQLQQNMAQMNAELHGGQHNGQQPNEQHSMQHVDQSNEPAKKAKSRKAKSFSEVAADGKAPPPPLKEPLAPEEKVKKPKFSKDNPHPNVMRPGGKTDRAEIDDVLAQTQAALKQVKKPEETNDMSSLDRALLDKVRNAVDEEESAE